MNSSSRYLGIRQDRAQQRWMCRSWLCSNSRLWLEWLASFFFSRRLTSDVSCHLWLWLPSRAQQRLERIPAICRECDGCPSFSICYEMGQQYQWLSWSYWFASYGSSSIHRLARTATDQTIYPTVNTRYRFKVDTLYNVSESGIGIYFVLQNKYFFRRYVYAPLLFFTEYFSCVILFLLWQKDVDRR